jgi:cyanophycinase
MNRPVAVPRPGPLVAIGGAEDKSREADILGCVLRMAHRETPAVAVITTASGYPDDVFEGYREVFENLGAGEVRHVRVRERADAGSEPFIDMIRNADVVFMSGGDQMRLTSIFGGSAALDAIRTRHAEGGVVAGTSAGAACQSGTMVYGGAADDSLRKGIVKMTAGFGLVDGVIIDTHFLERGRFTRLMEVGATNPEYLGVGIGEDAAVLFDGDTLRAFGPGHVVLVDSSMMTGSNVFDLDDGEAISVLNVIMHALVSGYGYSLKDRRVLGPGEVDANQVERSVAYP